MRVAALTLIFTGLLAVMETGRAAEEIGQLSPESQRAVADLRKAPAAATPLPPTRTAASTPAPGSYTPAKRPDGRHVVAIDIGHTIALHGATSARGEGEFYFNQRIAQQLFTRLEKSTIVAPFLINPRGGRFSLMDRPKLAAARGAELFISIHHDAANDKYLETWTPNNDGKSQQYSDRFRGYGVFVSKKNRQAERSTVFARLIGDSLKASGFTFSPHHAEPIKGENRPILDEGRGIYQYDDLIVLKHAAMPAVLVECGVIIHRNEELELKKPEVQERIVEALAGAIEKGFAGG